MGGVLVPNDNDDVQLKGATDATLIGNTGNRLLVDSAVSDINPATQNITALDTGTSSLTGAGGQVFYFGTPTTNSAASFTLTSVEAVSVQASLLGSGTMVVEVSADSGSFWFRPDVFQIATDNYTNSFSAPFLASVNTSGMTNIRVRSITSWSGTSTIQVRESSNARSLVIGEALPQGTNNIGSITNVTGTVSLPTGASTSSLQTTGNASLASIDAGIPAALGQTTASASLPVVIASDQTLTVSDATTTRATYSAAVSNLASAALSTDIFTISGSGTKTIRVTKISIDGFAATGGNFTINLIKRSAANTAGTSTVQTNVPHDSASAAGTAVVRAYTANPSALGTAVGTFRSNRVFISGVVTAASSEDEQQFGDLGQEIVLRGASEFLCMNLAGVTITTPALNIWCEWTES